MVPHDTPDIVDAEPTHPRLRLITRAFVGAASLVLAVGVFIVLVVTRPTVEVSDEGRPAVPVLVFAAQRVPVHRQWSGYGSVEAIHVADVPARVTTTVQTVPEGMRAGRRVERGEVLMELDASDFVQQAAAAEQRVAELAAALEQWAIERDRLATQLELDEADLELAQSEYDRVRRITEQLAGNQQQLDNAQRNLLAARRNAVVTREALSQMTPRRQALEAQLAAQRAQLEIARLDVERCTVRSPIAGFLDAVDVEPGEQVQPGTRVARVVNLERVEVPLRLPGSARQSVTIGDAVTISTTSDHAVTCEARVRRLSPSDDPQTRTVTAYVEVDQHHVAAAFGTPAGTGLLLPGTFVRGTVTVDAAQPRWVVPRRSVRGQRVQIVREGRLVSAPVEVDFVTEGEQPAFDLPDTQWAVLTDAADLTAGDLVLIEGSVSLLDGQPVEPVLPTASAADGRAEPATARSEGSGR